MQERSKICVPAHEDLELIAAELGAAPDNVGRFASSIIELGQALTYSRQEGITLREARQRSNGALKKVKKSLLIAREALHSEKSLLTHTLSKEVAQDLGSILSLPGIHRLIDGHVHLAFDEREIEFAARRSRDGGAEWVIDKVQEQIPSVVADYPTATLSELLKLILQTIDREIDLNRKHLTGRPRNTEREYVLDALKKLHEDTFGFRATTAPGGTFNKMCESIFFSLGLEDTGLQSAIERFLKPDTRTTRR